MEKLYAERLADLIIRRGVNLQRGEKLLIQCGAESYYYARIMAEKAYEAGAGYVQIFISDTHIDAARTRYQSDEELSFVPSFLKEFYSEAKREKWCRVRIDSGEERIGLPEFDSSRMQLLSGSLRSAQKEMSEEFMRDRQAWCVTCVPGPKWAEKVLGKGRSEEELTAVLAKILKTDRDDYLEAWDEFARASEQRKNALNALKIKRLHYKSSVTDLYIGLRENAHYEGAVSLLPDGRIFFPNLPTEEIFTTPDMYMTEGYVTTTRPVTVMGKVTEKVRLEFKEGKVVSCSAQKGQEVMDAYLAIDEGCRRLGEAALVSVDSPISESGLVFDSILIDENASCHIALGAGYPNCLDGSAALTSDEELHGMGINTSLMHTDFMIGSEDLDIEAECYDGRSVAIMKNGRFTI